MTNVLTDLSMDDPNTPVEPPHPAHRFEGLSQRFEGSTKRFGVVGAWMVLIVVFALLKPHVFFTKANFQTMFDSQAILLLLALGFIISLISGDFDLSLAGVFTIDLVLIGQLNIVHHVGFGVSWLVVLGVSVAIGLVQALIIVGLNLSSFIVTLGSGTALLGFASAIDHNARSGVSPSYAHLMAYKVFGMQTVFWVALGLVFLLWYVYGYTPLGRQLFFVGANRNVARLGGINVTLLRTVSLVGGSVVAGLAAIVTAGYLNGTDPTAGGSFLLPAISSALLGTTCIWPGRPNPWGTFVATYFLVTGYTGLQMLGLSGWIQQAFYGGALVVAVAISTISARRSGAETVMAAPQ
jgi:ribose transport system permease protein